MGFSEENSIVFFPTLQRTPPPTKYQGTSDGKDSYLWYITEDEYFRLSKIFGRDFQEAGVGGSVVQGLPSPCSGCGKYTEFIDWVWTAIQRRVHSTDFLFKAMQESRQGQENAHDVFCSECGLLTLARSKNNSEGGAANIFLAGRLSRSAYQAKPRHDGSEFSERDSNSSKVVVWGTWWLDHNGSTAKYWESLESEIKVLEVLGRHE